MKKSRRMAFAMPLLLAAATQAQAQEAATAKGAAAGEGLQEIMLEEIIVTAQMRGESLQRAAIPVSVVTGADLQKSGIAGVDLLGKNVPALQVQSSASGNLIFIRGIGSFSFLPTSDPAAAFNYDGVYVGRSGSTSGAFYDLERIEVLKGPQGTLYGRNATAGAINVLPEQPKLGETSGYVTASYGNYDALSGEGALNVPVGEAAAMRVSAYHSTHDGYQADGSSAERSSAARVQLKADLTPDVTVRLSADYAHVGGTGASSSYLGRYAFDAATQSFTVTPSNLSANEGVLTAAAQAFRQTGAAGTIAGRRLDPLLHDTYVDNDMYGVRGQVDWSTQIGTVSVISAWRKGDRDQLNYNSGQAVGNTSKSEQYSVETRLVSDGSDLIDYIAGLYYFHESIDDDVHNSGGAQAVFQHQDITLKSPSAYGRVTLHAGEEVRFVGGVRYTSDAKDYRNQSRSLAVLCQVPATSGGCPNVTLIPYTKRFEDQPVIPAAAGTILPIGNGGAVRRVEASSVQSFTQDKLTWRAAVEYDVDPRSMLYASVETGFRGGGFNTDSSYNPESITAYTVGSKNRFLGNKLQLNLEGFIWKYRDQQLTFLGINALGAAGPITRNIGKSTSQGIEVEALAQVTRTTQLRSNIQYLDTNYDAFVYVTPARPFSGCKVTPVGATFSVDCTGKPLYNAPKWTVNLGIQQRFELDGGLDLIVDADTQYRSGRYTSFEFVPQERVGSTWISNAQAKLAMDDANWSISAYVHNIGDKRYQTFATPVPASNLIVAISSAPRTYGLRLGVHF